MSSSAVSSDYITKTSVGISIPIRVNMRMFNDWIVGLPASESSTNQYNLFRVMEPWLKRPLDFYAQKTFFPLEERMKIALISRYFSIDHSLMFKLVGRKLSGKSRRDLDDISVNLGISLISCRRQFDNLLEIQQYIEENQSQEVTESTRNPTISSLIQDVFLIPSKLAKEYSSFIFLNYHQVTIPSKRVIDEFSILEISLVILDVWTINEKCTFLFNLNICKEARQLQAHNYPTVHIEDVAQQTSSNRNDAFFDEITDMAICLSSNRQIRDILMDIHSFSLDKHNVFFLDSLLRSHDESFVIEYPNLLIFLKGLQSCMKILMNFNQ